MTGTIQKPATFSTVERITGFPFTPTHSGIATILIVRGDGNTGWVERPVEISVDGAAYAIGRLVCYQPFAGSTFSFPVIAGKTYSITTGAEYVAFVDMRSSLTY